MWVCHHFSAETGKMTLCYSSAIANKAFQLKTPWKLTLHLLLTGSAHMVNPTARLTVVTCVGWAAPLTTHGCVKGQFLFCLSQLLDSLLFCKNTQFFSFWLIHLIIISLYALTCSFLHAFGAGCVFHLKWRLRARRRFWLSTVTHILQHHITKAGEV